MFARRRIPSRLAFAALSAVLVLGACGGPPRPSDVETCLRDAGLGVVRQSGVSAPVEAKINFDIASGTPDPERSGSVIYYASEDEAARNLKASGGSGPKGAIEQKGRVLFTPFGRQATGGRTAQESRGVVEGCVTRGEAAAPDDDGDKRSGRRSASER